MSSLTALSYRRTCGTGRWTLRHVRSAATATILRAFATDAQPSPAWDTWPEDTDPVYTARVAVAANLSEAA